MSQSKLGRTIARYELWDYPNYPSFKAVTICNGFQFPSSFQLRPSLGKLSAANSIVFRVLFQSFPSFGRGFDSHRPLQSPRVRPGDMGLAGVSGDLLDDSGVMPHKG